jgi:hypothetical protein
MVVAPLYNGTTTPTVCGPTFLICLTSLHKDIKSPYRVASLKSPENVGKSTLQLLANLPFLCNFPLTVVVGSIESFFQILLKLLWGELRKMTFARYAELKSAQSEAEGKHLSIMITSAEIFVFHY